MSSPARPGGPPLPRTWRYSAHAWRASRLLTRRRIDLLLRARSAAGLPVNRARFHAMGLPGDALEDTLRQVRSIAGWADAWTWTAQRFLGEARRHDGADHPIEGAVARRHAALSYHAAQLLAFDDPKKLRALRASATALFAQALPVLMPAASRVDPAWRTTALPGYLVRPERGPRTAPLAVLLNGSTTAKEETLLWAGPFLRHGVAVLALDWPGTGEAIRLGGVTADCDDLTDGVVALAAADPWLDQHRVALVGFSLGGALAVRAAAFDRRIAACVAVTPPYDPARWLASASELLVAQLTALAGGAAELERLTAAFALPGIVPRLRCPLLVIGAGRDLIVPPSESLRLCAEAGDLGTLLWYPDAAHGLYEAVECWTDDAARWLSALFGDLDDEGQSTGVDTAGAARTTAEAPVVSEMPRSADDGPFGTSPTPHGGAAISGSSSRPET